MGRQPIFDQPTCLHRPGKVAAGTLGERFFQTPVLVIYVDGLPIGRQHVLCALGVDPQGYKQVLGLAPGASENPTVVQYLLDGRLRRGLDPKVRRRLVIGGAKAPRAGIDAVFGTDASVQRCRQHKICNVLAHLPEEQHDQTKAAMRADFKSPRGDSPTGELDSKIGQVRPESLPGWLECEG